MDLAPPFVRHIDQPAGRRGVAASHVVMHRDQNPGTYLGGKLQRLGRVKVADRAPALSVEIPSVDRQYSHINTLLGHELDEGRIEDRVT
jgi:hypothetical protein